MTTNNQETAQITVVERDIEADQKTLKAFIDDNFPGVYFDVAYRGTKDGNKTLVANSDNFPREVEHELASIDGLKVLYEERDIYSDNEYTLIATHHDLIIVVNYSLPDYCDNECDAKVSITIEIGEPDKIAEAAQNLMEKEFTEKLKYEANSLLSFVLRNQKLFCNHNSFVALTKGFEINQKALDATEIDSRLSVVNRISLAIREASSLNQINAVKQLAPNIAQVTYDFENEYDDQGGYYKNISDYKILLKDDKEIVLGYGENWSDDFVEEFVSNNEDLLPQTLLDFIDSEAKDDAQRDAITQHMAELFGGAEGTFWTISNTLDELIWVDAEHGGCQISFADPEPAEEVESLEFEEIEAVA